MPLQSHDLGQVLPPKVIPAPSLSQALTIFFKLDPFPVRDWVSGGGWPGMCCLWLQETRQHGMAR